MVELCQKCGLSRPCFNAGDFCDGLTFQARMRSAQSGGTDFIAKPFSLMELAVKALMHLLSGQLRQVTPGFQPLARNPGP